MELDQHEFETFYAAARDDCLRVVLISAGDRQLAEDLVADAFTRVIVLRLLLDLDTETTARTLGMPAEPSPPTCTGGLAALRRDIPALDYREQTR